VHTGGKTGLLGRRVTQKRVSGRSIPNIERKLRSIGIVRRELQDDVSEAHVSVVSGGLPSLGKRR
jgi:hypothetical protein